MQFLHFSIYIFCTVEPVFSAAKMIVVPTEVPRSAQLAFKFF